MKNTKPFGMCFCREVGWQLYEGMQLRGTLEGTCVKGSDLVRPLKTVTAHVKLQNYRHLKFPAAK